MTSMNDVFPSKYLKWEDLQGRDHTLSISTFQMEEFKEDGRTVLKPIVYFQGKTKGMVCNKTNARTIAGIHGDQLEGWAGKTITIGVSPVEYQGEMRNGIRVRPPMPTYNQAPPAEFDQSAPPQQTAAPDTSIDDDLSDDIPF